MPTLDEVIEGIASSAKADFAFVLTRRGRLVTQTAPRDMPDSGRRRLTKLASSLPRDGGEVAQVTLAREQLVPYGGAAPVDVYVAAIDQAIVCVAMASWADKKNVVAAIRAAQPSIETLLAAALKRRGPSRRRQATPSSPPRRGGRATSSPPARRGRSRPPPTAGLVQLEGSEVVPAESMQASPSIQTADDPSPRPMVSSLPEITVGVAPLGRESLAAIEQDTPDGWPMESQGPQIQIGVAPLGRESLAAIDQDEMDRVPSGRAMASSPDLRVSLASLPDISEAEVRKAREEQVPGASGADAPIGRMTLPWVETAADAKRAADAARLGRSVASPRLAVRLQSLDEEELNSILDEETAKGKVEAMQRDTLVDEVEEIDDVDLVDDVDSVEEISGTVSLMATEDAEAPPQSGSVAVARKREPNAPAPPGRRRANPEGDNASLALWRDAITRMIDSERRRSVPPESTNTKSTNTKSSAPKARSRSTAPPRAKSGASKIPPPKDPSR